MFNLLTGPPISNTFFSFLSALWEWAERRKEVCCGQWAPKTAQAAIQKHEFMNVFDGGSRSCVIWMIDCFLFSLWWGLWALQRHGLRQKERTKRKTIMKFNGARRQEERVKWIPFNLSGSQHEMKWSVDGADWIGMNGTGPQAKRGKWNWFHSFFSSPAAREKRRMKAMEGNGFASSCQFFELEDSWLWAAGQQTNHSLLFVNEWRRTMKPIN